MTLQDHVAIEALGLIAGGGYPDKEWAMGKAAAALKRLTTAHVNEPQAKRMLLIDLQILFEVSGRDYTKRAALEDLLTKYVDSYKKEV